MKMKLIMESWRRHLEEITVLPGPSYEKINAALLASKFWEYGNEYEDVKDEESATPTTPATDILEKTLNKVFKELGLHDVGAIVHTFADYLDEEDPNSPWKSMQFDVLDNNNIKIMVLMELGQPDEHAGFDASKLVQILSAAVRHELVHAEQLRKQAENKGITLWTAFKEMLDDPKQVSDRAKFDNFKDYMQNYLSRHIEVDAHAHQAAENLVDTYGKEKALEVIGRDFDLDDPALPADVKKYKNFDVWPKAMKRFRSKMYSYIQRL